MGNTFRFGATALLAGAAVLSGGFSTAAHAQAPQPASGTVYEDNATCQYWGNYYVATSSISSGKTFYCEPVFEPFAPADDASPFDGLEDGDGTDWQLELRPDIDTGFDPFGWF